jgi:hypothetical protein
MEMPDERPDRKWTPEIVLDHLTRIIGANDRRYLDNFAASDKAVLAALAAQEKAVNAALAASEKAVLVAENNAEKWRDNANEWRSAMTDREIRFAMRSDLEGLKERLDRAEGKGLGVAGMWSIVVVILVLLMNVIGIVVAYRK